MNVPVNLTAWIVNPQRFEPQTAMPNPGVRPEEALHTTACLYTLSESRRMELLRQAATR